MPRLWNPAALLFILSPLLVGVPCHSVIAARRAALLSPTAIQARTIDDSARIQTMLANQPDFTGNVIMEAEGKILESGTTQIARKGKSWRMDSTRSDTNERNILLVQDEKAAYVLLPSEHTYTLVDGDPLYPLVFVPFGLMIRGLATATTIHFEILGHQRVGGHNCIKVALKESHSNSVEAILYFAQDLKGLAIRYESKGPESEWMGTDADAYELRDVSLDVSDAMFQLPNDYRLVKEPWIDDNPAPN